MSIAALASPGVFARLLAVFVACLAVATPRLGWGQGPKAEPSRDKSVQALWSDGGELLLAGGRGVIYVIDREGEAVAEAVDIPRFVDAAGTRAIGGVEAVFVASDGELVRWRPGALARDRAPLLAGDELVAVAMDARGTIYAVGRGGALYERGNRRWRVYPYPEGMRPLAAVASPGGQVYIVGRDGLLVRFDDGEWDRPLVPGLSPASSGAPWYDAWYSGVTETLWVRAGRDRLLELEFGAQRAAPGPDEAGEARPDAGGSEQARSGQREESESADDESQPDDGDESVHLHLSGSVPTREHPIPLGPPGADEAPAGFTAITGVSTADGDRVVTSAGDQLWLWERERFVPVAGELGLVYALALDEGEDVVWMASRKGLERVALSGTDEASEEAPLGAEDRKLLDRLRRREAWRRRQVDAPELFWMPTVRVDNGVAFPIGARPAAGYSLELAAGAMLAPLIEDRGPTLWLWPEAAYRFETHPSRGGHLLDLGLGVGFGTHLIAGYYRPRFVVGGVEGGTDPAGAVYGLRHGLALSAVWGILGLEFSHQYLGSNRGALTDLRVGLSINLAPLVWLGILWATLPVNDRPRR